MKAIVLYNESGEAYKIEVNERNGHEVTFKMDGSTAVAYSAQQPEGETHVYLDRVSKYIDYVETLPFVQAVKLQEYDSSGVEQ